MCLAEISVAFRRFVENWGPCGSPQLRSSLPNNHACLLITASCTPEGGLRVAGNRGTASTESGPRFNKKKQRDLRDKNNGGRPRTKSTRHLPQSRSKNQNATDDFSGQRGKAAGNCDLVRQFLPAAAARRSLAACLQACDFDHHAGSTDPVVRRRRGCTGLRVS